MTLRVAVRQPLPDTSIVVPSRLPGAVKGMLCGLVSGAVGFFLVFALFMISGSWGWRFLPSIAAVGLIIGAVAGVPIGLFRLRPRLAGLVTLGLAVSLDLTVCIVYVSLGQFDPSAKDELVKHLPLSLSYVLSGYAAGMLTAMLLKAWEQHDRCV